MTDFNVYKLTRTEDREVKEEIRRIVEEHAPITVRGVYYQCVLSPRLPFLSKDSGGDNRNYRLVQSRLKRLRQYGVIPWDAVIDPSRPNYARHRWTSLEQFALDVPSFYSPDVWADCSLRPLVLLEKEGQIPVYEQHAAKYGVDVWACKGYSSVSHMQALSQHIKSLQQNVVVLVCADWDPSGCDWPRAAEKEIESHLWEHDAQVEFRRVLVEEADLGALSQSVALRIPNPNDPRTANWLTKYGYSANDEIVVEMDALAPSTARERMQKIYEGMRKAEDPSWDLSKDSAHLTQQRERIRKVLSSLKS